MKIQSHVTTPNGINNTTTTEKGKHYQYRTNYGLGGISKTSLQSTVTVGSERNALHVREIVPDALPAKHLSRGHEKLRTVEGSAPLNLHFRGYCQRP